MTKHVYKIIEGGMHDKFLASRAKIQFIGGGFGNGKTAASVVKALKLATDYPGSNGLIARSTYPKLNDTIRKEVFKWCPKQWIKRSPTKDDNTLILTNGTNINFRYMAQRGKDSDQSTSNLLSATFDWIVVDQIEDPEFIHKDFMDLMGRLRGSTEYIGNDPTMPKVGPRWIILTSNPTRNWVYRKLVKPLHDYKKGIFNPDLLCQVDNDGKPILVDGKPVPIIELFEGSTHENIENVGEDFISGMLATFTNDSMRKRFIFGEWGALSGLVYNVFNEAIHELPHGTIIQYLTELRYSGYKPTFFEGYDHGLIRPSCYGLFFADDDRNVFLLDGFYSKEQTIDTSCELIKQIREDYGVSENNEIFADPQLFRRSPGSTGVVGVTVAELFARNGIRLIRGNRDIPTGIAKNIQYLTPVELHEHPITGAPNAPHFFVSDKCDWFVSEINEWMYKADTSGEVSDTTSDKNDHAMDMWKYAMTHTPKLASYVGKRTDPPAYLYWHEIESANNQHKVLPRHRA